MNNPVSFRLGFSSLKSIVAEDSSTIRGAAEKSSTPQKVEFASLLKSNLEHPKTLLLPPTSSSSKTAPIIKNPERLRLSSPVYDALQRDTVRIRSFPQESQKNEAVRKIISSAYEKHPTSNFLSLRLVESLVKFESSFSPTAVSSDGHYSKGLFQLLDGTALDRLEDRQMPATSYKPFDAENNTLLGLDHLKYLHTHLENLVPPGDLNRFILAAYNSGLGRVQRVIAKTSPSGEDKPSYNSIESLLPKSTAQYVKNIINDSQ